MSSPRSMVLHGQTGSLDAAIRATTGDPFLSDRLFRQIAQLPDHKPILLLYNKNGRLDYRNQLISYVAWPRPVEFQASDREVERVGRDTLEPHKYSALILSDVKLKQPLPNTRRLHPELEIVRLP